MRPAESPSGISNHLVQTLVNTSGLNEFFENAIPLLAESFGADRAILIDYRENSSRFDLLLWTGYPAQSRFDLQRRIADMNLEKAILQKEPFLSQDDPKLLFLPLYFLTTLE